MGRKHLLGVVVALCCLAASCGNSESDTASTPVGADSTDVDETLEWEDNSERTDDSFDPAKWDELPDWWLEVQDVDFNRLVEQQTEVVETLSLVTMNPGNESFVMVVPQDWEEVCRGMIRCVYSTPPDSTSPTLTKGFAADWSDGTDAGRMWPDHPSRIEGTLRPTDPLTYVEGETEPLTCGTNQTNSESELRDLYPEPWFVACTETIDEFTIARVEMFKLNENCEPYGNSVGAWIGWEHAHQSKINNFVDIMAIQMLADRMKCVTVDTLLGVDYGHWHPTKSSLDNDSGSFWFMDRITDLPDYHRIWVQELQRRTGAEPDGIYGPKTHNLHFQTANKLRDSKSVPLGSSIPLISSGPCGTFKLDLSKWPSEDLISRWTDSDGWVPEDSSLVTPLLSDEPWWWTEENERYEEPMPPPLPMVVSTGDATGDGVDDFILRWWGGNYTIAGVATIHENESGCSWRYVNEKAGWRLIEVGLGETSHDYWDVSAKWQADSQRNSCYLNRVYGRYNPETDDFETTMCLVYSG
jgi:hypothetical protein